jgi:hypothetical protein
VAIVTIPTFGPDGLLLPGDYEVSLEDLAQSCLVLGPDDREEHPAWDASWRKRLVENLEVLTRQLWQVGVRDVYADGSFVEDKDHPNDIDGYFVCSLDELKTGELTRRLNLLDPFKVWTWDPASRKPYRGYPKRQLPTCGIGTAWNSIRMYRGSVLEAVSATSTGMSSNSLRRFDNRGVMANPEES